MITTEYLPKSQRLRVGLIGFGKTGRAVAATLLMDKSIDLVWVVKKSRNLENRSVPEFLGIESDEEGTIYSIGELNFDTLQSKSPVDAIVDFSSEEGMDFYGEVAAEHCITIVSAISALSENRSKKLRKFSRSTRVLWSPNITLGINFLILASTTLQKIAPQADISILEEHFRLKKEISGTAKKMADVLSVAENDIKSVRAGGIIGVHEVLFGFPYQTVRLKHESISREAFGDGAVFALKELENRDIGFYTMEDLMGELFVRANSNYIPAELKPIKNKKSFFRFTILGNKRRRKKNLIRSSDLETKNLSKEQSQSEQHSQTEQPLETFPPYPISGTPAPYPIFFDI